MKLALSLSTRQVSRAFFWVIFFLVASGLTVQVAKYGFGYRQEWTRWFNLDREYNLPSFYSSVVLAWSGVLLRSIARCPPPNTSPQQQQSWGLLSVIFFALALDEWFSLHELLIVPDLAKWANLPGFLRQIWVIPAVVIVALFLQRFWQFWRNLPRQLRWRMALSGGIYLFGALGMEMVGSAYADLEGQQNLIYALMTVLEEMAEMVGIAIFVRTLLAYWLSYREAWSATLTTTVSIT